MEAFLSWLLQNVAWDTLKKALPQLKQRDLDIFRQALADAQDRLAELEGDREMLDRIVQQRNLALADLTKANRRVKELESQLAKARAKAKKRK